MRTDSGDGERVGETELNHEGGGGNLRGRSKKGRGRGEEETLSPQSPSFFPSSLSPTRFDACYAG